MSTQPVFDEHTEDPSSRSTDYHLLRSGWGAGGSEWEVLWRLPRAKAQDSRVSRWQSGWKAVGNQFRNGQSFRMTDKLCNTLLITIQLIVLKLESRSCLFFLWCHFDCVTDFFRYYTQLKLSCMVLQHWLFVFHISLWACAVYIHTTELELQIIGLAQVHELCPI